ncbi:MAG: hypothetical protein IH861_14160 [Chloroflexi bacterium]|nr:hypothetical protein [Chloroflexota bacterium]
MGKAANLFLRADNNWMRTYVETNTAPKTRQGYLYNIQAHINPVIGGVRLQKLTGRHIKGL